MNDFNLVKTSLNDQTKLRLNEINKIKDYLTQKLEKEKQLVKNLVNTLLLLIMLTKFLLFYLDLLVL